MGGGRGELERPPHPALVYALVRICWKQSWQYTGLPCVGMKGTSVVVPHTAQTT